MADSRFQDELLRQAKDAGKIEKGFELPPACRDNSPERIERALADAREEGLLARFPFETDFTPIEQRLLPALQALKSASPLRLGGLLARGLGASAQAGRNPGLPRPHGARAAFEPDRARLRRALARGAARLIGTHGAFSGKARPREGGGGVRFYVRKCDNAKMLERFLFSVQVKPLQITAGR